MSLTSLSSSQISASLSRWKAWWPEPLMWNPMSQYVHTHATHVDLKYIKKLLVRNLHPFLCVRPNAARMIKKRKFFCLKFLVFSFSFWVFSFKLMLHVFQILNIDCWSWYCPACMYAYFCQTVNVAVVFRCFFDLIFVIFQMQLWQ